MHLLSFMLGHQTWMLRVLNNQFILVLAIYHCKYNLPARSSLGHQYYAASNDILENINPETAKKFPARLFYRSACSLELPDYVIVHIGRGHNFQELKENIASIKFCDFLSHHTQSDDESNFHSNLVYSPSNSDQLKHIFLDYFQSVQNIFQSITVWSPMFVLCSHVVMHLTLADTLELNEMRTIHLYSNFKTCCWLEWTWSSGKLAFNQEHSI